MKQDKFVVAPQPIDLPEIDVRPTSGNSVVPTLQALQSVKVDLSIVIGTAKTTLGELTNLKSSSILKLDRALDCPVDVMVEGAIVARGTLVAVGDNFGVRVIEVAKIVS